MKDFGNLFKTFVSGFRLMQPIQLHVDPTLPHSFITFTYIKKI